MPQQLFTRNILRQLRANGEASLKGHIDHLPVVKLFNPYGAGYWLLTESDPVEPDHVFGLCDLGKAAPKLGHVSRHDLESCVIRLDGFQCPLERDELFAPVHTIAVYALAARRAKRIIEDDAALEKAQVQVYLQQHSRQRKTTDEGWTDWPPHHDQDSNVCGND